MYYFEVERGIMFHINLSNDNDSDDSHAPIFFRHFKTPLTSEVLDFGILLVYMHFFGAYFNNMDKISRCDIVIVL